MQTAPLPFLNRFSKFALSFHDALQDRVEFYKQPDNKPHCFYSEPPDNIELLFKGLVAGGEDFASVLAEVPGAFIFLGACPPESDFMQAATNHSNKAVFDDRVLADGAALLASLAIDTLSD